MENHFVVFVVEDDDWFSRLIVHTIEMDADFSVSAIKSAEELFKQLAKQVPEIITLDYRLPDATGEEILKRLQSDYPDVEVLVIS
ncbi:MAG: response regulator, partial [Luteibaculum sp.]